MGIIYPGGFDQVRFVETAAATSSHLTDSSDFTKNVIIPTCNDVLNGRGKSTNAWQGNVFYRDLIRHYKLEYIVATPEEQKLIATNIFTTIRGLNPPGRFLEMNKTSFSWCEVGYEKVIFKIRQALREGAPELREQLTPNEISFRPQDEMSDKDYKQFVEMIFDVEDMECSSKSLPHRSWKLKK